MSRWLTSRFHSSRTLVFFPVLIGLLAFGVSLAVVSEQGSYSSVEETRFFVLREGNSTVSADSIRSLFSPVEGQLRDRLARAAKTDASRVRLSVLSDSSLVRVSVRRAAGGNDEEATKPIDELSRQLAILVEEGTGLSVHAWAEETTEIRSRESPRAALVITFVALSAAIVLSVGIRILDDWQAEARPLGSPLSPFVFDERTWGAFKSQYEYATTRLRDDAA
jgi:hypothetical protein